MYYWSENEVKLWNEAHESGKFISINATGRLVKSPNIYKNEKCSPVFLYVIVTQFGKKIYPISQNISSRHDTLSIFSWLSEWIFKGAVIPRVCVIDCALALLSATCLAFNKMYYSTYLEICYELLMKTSTERPRYLIKRDRAHLIKNICTMKLFTDENWCKKDLYVHAISFLMQVDDINMFEDILETLFILCESKCQDKGSESFKRKEWLFGVLGTFDSLKYYEIY